MSLFLTLSIFRAIYSTITLCFYLQLWKTICLLDYFPWAIGDKWNTRTTSDRPFQNPFQTSKTELLVNKYVAFWFQRSLPRKYFTLMNFIKPNWSLVFEYPTYGFLHRILFLSNKQFKTSDTLRSIRIYPTHWTTLNSQFCYNY